MRVQEKRKSHPDMVDYFKKLPFYNKYIEKPKNKRLKNIDLLSERPFYEKLNVAKTNCAIRGYAMSDKVELVVKKDLLIQLEASKSSINNMFNNLLDQTKSFKYLLDQTKSFKYQITLKVKSKKQKPNGEIEFTLNHFNSTIKTIINRNFGLGKSFQ